MWELIYGPPHSTNGHQLSLRLVCVCATNKSHDAGLLLPDTAGGVSHMCTWIHNLQFVALGMDPFILPRTASILEAQISLPKAV